MESSLRAQNVQIVVHDLVATDDNVHGRNSHVLLRTAQRREITVTSKSLSDTTGSFKVFESSYERGLPFAENPPLTSAYCTERVGYMVLLHIVHSRLSVLPMFSTRMRKKATGKINETNTECAK